MIRRETHRSSPSSGRTAAGAGLVRGLAALAICMSGIVITGLLTTGAPAGAANPAPLLYEIDSASHAINVFPATASGNVAPSVTNTSSALSGGPTGAVFDSKGDLWVASADSGSPSILEFTPSQLAATGSPAPAVIITDSAHPNALAFDASGNLWATNFSGGVQKFTPGQLTSSGSPTPAVTLSGAAVGTWGLNFDAAGDLWVGTYATSNTVLEYTPAQLTASGSPTPAVTLSGLKDPIFPTFDAKGDLWVSEDFNGTVVEVHARPADLLGQPHASGLPDQPRLRQPGWPGVRLRR